MKYPFRSLAAAALLAATTLVSGCSGTDSPTQPDARQAAAAPRSLPSFAQSQGRGLDEIARFNRRPQITIAWAKKWIGPQGGRLDFYGFAIEVPRGAVTKTTMFTIRVPVDPWTGEHAVAEFGPHNQSFLRPVSIELPYAGTSAEGSTPGVLWFNEAVKSWQPVGGGLTTDGQRVRATVQHFSSYGTSATRSGVVAIAGG